MLRVSVTRKYSRTIFEKHISKTDKRTSGLKNKPKVTSTSVLKEQQEVPEAEWVGR